VVQQRAQLVKQFPDSPFRELCRIRLSVQTSLDQSKLTDNILKTPPARERLGHLWKFGCFSVVDLPKLLSSFAYSSGPLIRKSAGFGAESH
jgi:hypothetical protein